MILSFVFLLAGLMLLLLAGDYLVKGAVGLAEQLGISPLVIGLTIVAFGTSAPELFISVEAAIGGSAGISIGNVVGSNIANVLLVVGLPALFAPVCANEPGIRRNAVVMIALTLVFMLMLFDGVISRFEGGILFALILAYVIWQFGSARTNRRRSDPADDYHDEIGTTPTDWSRIGYYIVGGMIGLPLGAHLTITGALDIALAFGVSEAAIGLTIVAIGTSLPELATSFMATLRGRSAVAVGNVIGSNIFNIACIMGVTALIVPLDVPARVISIDMWVMLATSVVMAVFALAHLTARKMLGLAMTGTFTVYVISVF